MGDVLLHTDQGYNLWALVLWCLILDTLPPKITLSSLYAKYKVCIESVQVRIEFEPLYVRHLWPMNWPQYPAPAIWSRLQNPLKLSQGLVTSLTGPQLGSRTAPDTMLLQAENGIMVQHPTCRNFYVFNGVWCVSYSQLSEDISKWQEAKRVLTHKVFHICRQ